MKFFIIIVVLTVVVGAFAVTPEVKAKLDGIVKKCTQDSGVKPENLQKVKGGDTSDNSPEMKKFAECYLKTGGALNDKNELNVQVVIDTLSAGSTADEKKQIEQFVKGCKAQSDSISKEDRPLNLYRCYAKNQA